MERILEAVTTILKDWVSLALLGLGITYAPSVFIGGLFLAFAGAAIARAWEKDRAEKAGDPWPRETHLRFWIVILTAFFVSTLVSIFVHSYFPNWSIQVCMGVSGFASRKAVNFGMDVVESLSTRGKTVADVIAEKLHIEPEKKGGE